MLSILICSANPKDLLLVRKNIENTIGAIPYEIIAFDNSEGRKGISQVYNAGIQQARYELICFMHEDVNIKSNDWGNIVSRIFSGDSKIGIVGVAGGGYKSLTPSGWYCLEFENPAQSYQNILQGYKLDSKDEIHAYHNPYNEQLSDVVCVDGVWFCTRKSIALKNFFDEKLLKGFHGYDLDFCLNVFGKYRVVVTYEIIMKHASEGNFNKAWLNEILKVHQKWNKYLPLTTSKVSDKEIYLTEKRSIKRLIEQMLDWNYSFTAIQKMLVAGTASKRMPIRLFFKGYIHLVKQVWK